MFVAILSGKYKYYYTVHENMYSNVYLISFSFINILIVQILKKTLRTDKAVCVKVLC